MISTVLATIEGRVQGVSYRYWTRAEALRRGLRGWVRNRPDGAVEAVFSGDVRRVEDMLAACRMGPPAARVSDVRAETIEARDLPASFDIRHG